MSPPYKVGIFRRTQSDLPSIEGFAACRDRRFEFVMMDGLEYEPCDVAITFGCVKPHIVNPQVALRTKIREVHKGPLIVAESGFLGRTFVPSSFAARLTRRLRHSHNNFTSIIPYWRIGIGGVFADDADFANENAPADRWEKLRDDMGLRLRPYRSRGRKILVSIDNGIDADDISNWVKQISDTVRRYSDKTLLFRPHQNTTKSSYLELKRILADIPNARVSLFSPDASKAFRDCWALICGRSGISVDALLAGVPPICLSPQNIAYSITSNSLSHLSAPALPERELWFRRLAYAQWTSEEMADGTTWSRLAPKILALL